jgi:hypothetical protein
VLPGLMQPHRLHCFRRGHQLLPRDR